MEQLREYQNAAPNVETIVSDEFADIPIIEMKTFIDASNHSKPWNEQASRECQKVAECLHKFGILLVVDPRVKFQDNEDYLDMMEQYFEKVGEDFYNSQEVKDIKPEHLYQTGLMPEFTEIARNHWKLRLELDLDDEDQPFSPMTPVLDAKWRFMWKIGKRPTGAADDFPQVIPEGFPHW